MQRSGSVSLSRPRDRIQGSWVCLANQRSQLNHAMPLSVPFTLPRNSDHGDTLLFPLSTSTLFSHRQFNSIPPSTCSELGCPAHHTAQQPSEIHCRGSRSDCGIPTAGLPEVGRRSMELQGVGWLGAVPTPQPCQSITCAPACASVIRPRPGPANEANGLSRGLTWGRNEAHSDLLPVNHGSID